MSICETLERLSLASPRTKKRVLLTPELIEAALARLDRELTLDEQKVVLRVVGDRKKVRWPDWWQAC